MFKQGWLFVVCGAKVGELEPLFALMERLRQYPDLIAVADDFVRELAPDR